VRSNRVAIVTNGNYFARRILAIGWALDGDLGDLADGRPVFSMKGDDHLQAHPEMADLLPQLLAMVSYGEFTGREHDREFDLGRVVGHSRCVATTDADEIVAALHKHEGDDSVEIKEKPLSVKRLEWEHLQKVLVEHDGNISAAARALGMHRRTLQRKLEKRPVKD